VVGFHRQKSERREFVRTLIKKFVLNLCVASGMAALAAAAQADGPSAALVAKTDNAAALQAEIAGRSFARVTVVLKADASVQQSADVATSLQSMRTVAASAQAGFVADHLSTADQAKSARQNAYVFKHVPSVTMNADAADLERLAADPRVLRIERDIKLTKKLTEAMPLIGMPAAYAKGGTGSGRMVAVLDTGVQTDHPFFGGRVTLEACRSGGGYAEDSLCPNGTRSQEGPGASYPPTCANSVGCWHGTHVAGIAAGNNTAGGSPSNGVAKSANIFSIQVFSWTDATKTDVGASSSDVNAALDLVLTKHLTNPIDAVNMSLGGSGTPGTCDDWNVTTTNIMRSLRNVGVATVVAAGNDSSTSDTSFPACISHAIAVGSTDKSDVISDFSNMSDKVDVMAPGSSIKSSVTNSAFGLANGTSMSTPAVAGAIAAIRAVVPDATVTEIVDALKATGKPIIDTRTGGSVTRPRIQVDTALAALISASAGRAVMVSPANGTTLTAASQTFTWIAGSNATQYSLAVGTTGVGSTNIYSQTLGTGLTATVSGMPITGGTVYVRLGSLIAGVWQYNNYTYAAYNGGLRAVMTSPVDTSALTAASQTFSWTTGTEVTEYWLFVGTTGVGSANLFNQSTGTGLTKTVGGLPSNGSTVYVRLWSLLGKAWFYNDYTYTGYNSAVKAVMISPADGTAFASKTQAFTWNAGSGVSQYWLYVGTTGAGSANLFNQSTGTNKTVSVTGLPSNGSPVYVRLWSMAGVTWQFADYTYTSANTDVKSVMVSPADGATLPNASQTFNWSVGNGVADSWLYVGTTGAGSYNLYNKAGGTTRTATVSGLPNSGTVYVRLWSLTSGAWVWNDYTYTSANLNAKSAMTAPAADGATLTGATQTFNWNAGVGVTQYWLYVGTTGAGSYNLLNQSTGTAPTKTVSGLPILGEKVYVRLWSLLGGAWVFNDYTYNGAALGGKAAMTAPAANGATLAGAAQTFAWSAGSGVSQYWLAVGTTGPGSYNLYNKSTATSRSAAVAGLPRNGSTVYVRLWSLIAGVWVLEDYTYKAAPN
jgi:serine protease